MAVSNIPTEQWAQVIEKIEGPAIYKKVPVPQPGPDEVLVNIKFSGVCHTDMHAMWGDFPVKSTMPLIGGHEGAGIVVAKGENVKDIEIGEKAGVHFYNSTCTKCGFCQQSHDQLCKTAQISGVTVDGTFQQYAISKASIVARIPDDVELDTVAPVLCAGIAAYNALKQSGARPGDSVAIVGAGGGLGTMAIQYAKAMGMLPIGIDGGDEKGQLCMDLGATAYADFTKSKDLVADVRAASSDGDGPQAVILFAASEMIFRAAGQYVKSGGTIVCVGYSRDALLLIPLWDVIIRMITVKGVATGNRQEMAEAINIFRRGVIKIPNTVVGLSELMDVFQLMKEGKISGRYVVDTSR